MYKATNINKTMHKSPEQSSSQNIQVQAHIGIAIEIDVHFGSSRAPNTVTSECRPSDI